MKLLEALEKYSDKQLILRCCLESDRGNILIPLTLTMSEAEFKDHFPIYGSRWVNIVFTDFLKFKGSFHIGVLVTRNEIENLWNAYFGQKDLYIEWYALSDFI